MQIKRLVSICHATLTWNGFKFYEKKKTDLLYNNVSELGTQFDKRDQQSHTNLTKKIWDQKKQRQF